MVPVREKLKDKTFLEKKLDDRGKAVELMIGLVEG